MALRDDARTVSAGLRKALTPTKRAARGFDARYTAPTRDTRRFKLKDGEISVAELDNLIRAHARVALQGPLRSSRADLTVLIKEEVRRAVARELRMHGLDLSGGVRG